MCYTAPRNCSLVQQCKAAISGTYAARLRDPFIKGDSIKTISHNANTYCSAVPSRVQAEEINWPQPLRADLLQRAEPLACPIRLKPDERNVSKSSQLTADLNERCRYFNGWTDLGVLADKSSRLSRQSVA